MQTQEKTVFFDKWEVVGRSLLLLLGDMEDFVDRGNPLKHFPDSVVVKCIHAAL